MDRTLNRGGDELNRGEDELNHGGEDGPHVDLGGDELNHIGVGRGGGDVELAWWRLGHVRRRCGTCKGAWAMWNRQGRSEAFSFTSRWHTFVISGCSAICRFAKLGKWCSVVCTQNLASFADLVPRS